MIFAICNESAATELGSPALVQMKVDIQDAYDTEAAPAWGWLPVDVWVGALADAEHRQDQRDGEPLRILRILDDIQGEDGMLADHYVDDKGRPTMELSVAMCRKVGGNFLDVVSEAISHELFECARNPFCRLWLDAAPAVVGKKVAAEICDPVQGSGWRNGKSLIANFVLPAWEDGGDSEGPYDFVTRSKGQRILTKPFACYPAGYLVFDDGTHQFGEKVRDIHRAHALGSGRRLLHFVDRRARVSTEPPPEETGLLET